MLASRYLCERLCVFTKYKYLLSGHQHKLSIFWKRPIVPQDFGRSALSSCAALFDSTIPEPRWTFESEASHHNDGSQSCSRFCGEERFQTERPIVALDWRQRGNSSSRTPNDQLRAKSPTISLARRLFDFFSRPARQSLRLSAEAVSP